jgi:hypothetical protein
MSGDVCPLMSMTEPLKQLGDYPKCTRDKCALWVYDTSSCGLLGSGAMISDPLDVIAKAFDAIKEQLDAYNTGYSNNVIVSALIGLGQFAAVFDNNSVNLNEIINDLHVIVRAKRQEVERQQARRKLQKSERKPEEAADAALGGD